MMEPTERSISPRRMTQGHAEGGDGDDGDLLEDVHEVRQRQEAAVAEGEDGAEDDEGDDDAAVLAHQAVQGGVKGWG